MIMFLFLFSSGIAQCPGSEIGDAVFRPLLVLPDEHAAVYRNSDGRKDWKPMEEDLLNSSWEHSVIQASGEGTVVHWQDYETFLGGLSYRTQIGLGWTAPIEMRTEIRKKVITAARSQYGAVYPKFPDHWRWPYIKFPRERAQAQGDTLYPNGSFRCDGLVEYAYEHVFNTDKPDPDDRGFFTQQEEEHCWLIFTPQQLRLRMTPEDPTAPDVEISYDSDDKQLIVKADDGDYGSGIDWIGLYKDEVEWEEGLFNTVYPSDANLIGESDDDKDGEKTFNLNIDIVNLEREGDLLIIAVAADRAGNFGVRKPLTNTWQMFKIGKREQGGYDV